MGSDNEVIHAYLTLLAISDNNQLYHVSGIRKNGVVAFNTPSGIPIRSEVRKMSAQYNYDVKTSEILYVTKKSNELRHLVRDPSSSMWKESKVAVRKSKSEKANFMTRRAFITTITLTNGKWRSGS